MLRQVDRILLLGTAHVASQSRDEIREVIERYQPEVVALELDMNRFQQLMGKGPKKKPSAREMIKAVGVTGYLFAQLGGYVQKKVGQNLGIEPGVDMKTAYEEAREYKLATALIDQDLRHVLRKLSSIPFTRKVRLFTRLFFKSFDKRYKQKFRFDIKQGVPSPEMIEELLELLKKDAPDLYRVLIHDRNVHMGQRLLRLHSQHEGLVLAVVGAGHVSGMEKFLKHHLMANTVTYSTTVDALNESF